MGLFPKKFVLSGQTIKPLNFISKWASPVVFEQHVSTSRIVVLKYGPIWTTKKLTLVLAGRLILSEELHTQKESYLKRLESKPNSLTLLSVNVYVFNLSRTKRKSPHSYPMTVA